MHAVMHDEHGHTAPVVLGNNAAATQKKKKMRVLDT
jgi:hypothetical protein